MDVVRVYQANLSQITCYTMVAMTRPTIKRYGNTCCYKPLFTEMVDNRQKKTDIYKEILFRSAYYYSLLRHKADTVNKKIYKHYNSQCNTGLKYHRP